MKQGETDSCLTRGCSCGSSHQMTPRCSHQSGTQWRFQRDAATDSRESEQPIVIGDVETCSPTCLSCRIASCSFFVMCFLLSKKNIVQNVCKSKSKIYLKKRRLQINITGRQQRKTSGFNHIFKPFSLCNYASSSVLSFPSSALMAFMPSIPNL